MPTIRRRCHTRLRLLLLPLCAYPHATTSPVVIGVFSAYQSDVISNKISALTDTITQTLRRPVYVMTIGDAASLRKLLAERRPAIVFLSLSLLSPESTLMPLVQTDVPLGLFARPGANDRVDLKAVSIPESSAPLN